MTAIDHLIEETTEAKMTTRSHMTLDSYTYTHLWAWFDQGRAPYGTSESDVWAFIDWLECQVAEGNVYDDEGWPQLWAAFERQRGGAQ